MRRLQAFFVIIAFASSHQHEIVKRESKGERRVVCYYTNWSVYRPGTAKFNPQNINPYLCTHLIYAFGGLDRENGLRPYDKYQDIEQGGYAKFTGLKTYNKALKTMLAIGGWNEGSARFSPLVADEERRKEFVKNVVKFLRVNHFDGLDLDWEYPAFRDGGKPRDKDNYAQLVQELREEFERESSKTGRPRLLLTMAVPAGLEYIDKGYDIPKLNQYLDFMNILSYDYHSAFEPSINHHSPLYSLEEESEYNFDSQLTIDATVKHYLLKGADANKLVLGIPTYGRSYTLFNEESTELGSPADGPGEQGDATREKGYLAYYEICANVKNGWTIRQPKESAMGPYAYNGNQWVGYDDEAIVRKKSQYVNEKNLGGIMFWSIDNDDFRGKCHSRPYPLIEAAKEALVGKGVSNKLATSPRGGKTNSKIGKPKPQRTTTPAPTQTPSFTTPDPPTTPDPGSDFVCKDEGFFPHPRDCKKYFWCLDSGPSNLGIVAHQFTCPSGLFFNKAADSCDFARNVICNKKTTTTTTAAPKTTKQTGSSNSKPHTTVRTTTTTTTTTTEAPPPEEEEEYFDEQVEEDPQTIKQLISLIKKLGGVAELEKQLEGSSGTDSTTPSISKSLYDRVISKGPPKYQTFQRNGPSGPQNEGLPRESGRSSSFKKDKPQYVTIRRERPSTSTTEIIDSVEYEDEVEEEKPKYKTFQRNRGSQNEGIESERPTERSRPKYQPIDRFRTKQQENKKDTEESSSPDKSTTLRYTNIFRSRSPPNGDTSTATTSRYVTLQRQRPQIHSEEGPTTENELSDEEYITEEFLTETTTTARPRIKVSDVLSTTPAIRTSTRVVTQVVEGATQRQRVPLHKFQQLLKDSENLIETVTKPFAPQPTEEPKSERPILSNFNRRRPDIVITSTLRSTPAYLSQRRYKSRSTTTESTEVKKKSRGFVPSRTNYRSTTEESEESIPKEVDKPQINRFYLRQKLRNTENESGDSGNKPFVNRFSSRERTSEPSLTTTERFNKNRSRYFNIRRTTEKPSEVKEEALFSREYSHETNVVRRPVVKPSRFTSRGQTTAAEVNEPDHENSTEPTTSDSSVSEEPIGLQTNVSESSLLNKDNFSKDSVTELLSPELMKHQFQNETEQQSIDSPISVEISTESTQRNATIAILDTTSTTTTNFPSTSIKAIRRRIIPAIIQTTPRRNISHNVSTSTVYTINTTDTTTTTTTTQTSTTTIPTTSTTNPSTTTTIPTTSTSTKIRIESNNVESQKNDQETSSNDILEETKNTPGKSTHIPARNRTKIVLRKRKPINKPKIETSSINPEPVSHPELTTTKIELDHNFYGKTKIFHSTTNAPDNKSRDKTRVVVRRRKPESVGKAFAKEELPKVSRHESTTRTPTQRVSRGRTKFTNSEQQSNSVDVAHDQSISNSRHTVTVDRTSKQSENPNKQKRIIIRGKKKFTDNAERDSNNENLKRTRTLNRGEGKTFSSQRRTSFSGVNQSTPLKTANVTNGKTKIRRVVLKKTIKDLAVGESGIPGSQEDNYEIIGSDHPRAVIKIWDSLANEEVDNYFNDDDNSSSKIQEITRSRRPFNRKPIPRSTTTTTTEIPTTTKQRTTIQSLRQRLNRFKTERHLKQSTPPAIPDDVTTSRPRKGEFRRVIKPSTAQTLVDDAQLDLSQEEPITKDTVSKTTQYHRETSFRPSVNQPTHNEKLYQTTQIEEQATEGSFTDEHITDEHGVIRFHETNESESDEELGIPDLANVAVAAIQSLATSPPTKATEEYSITTTRPSTKHVITTQRIRSRPTRPQRPASTTPIIIPTRSLLRSSPRPFSKVTHTSRNLPNSGPAIYEDYEDYYAEPVDIPLSGKVRIHNDGYIECLDIGNFPHPFSCRKFISCAKMENGHLLGWEYTCPKGLSFDPIGGICNWNAGLGCKE